MMETCRPMNLRPMNLRPVEWLRRMTPRTKAAEETVNAGAPKSWYIIHTYSGFENKVAESLKGRVRKALWLPAIIQIGQLLIPIEEVVELRNGKKVTSKRLLYPGLRAGGEMEMNDELWRRREGDAARDWVLWAAAISLSA